VGMDAQDNAGYYAQYAEALWASGRDERRVTCTVAEVT
jgi:hypothetical protein